MRKHMLASLGVATMLMGSTAGVVAQEAGPDGLVTKEVEPGVERIVRDDAGHDLAEKHPRHRYDMDHIAIGADGTVWLSTTYSRTDNEAHRDGGAHLWALGRPGIKALAPYGDLVPLPDGTLLIIGDGVTRFDGKAFVPDDGPEQRPLGGGKTLLLTRPEDASVEGLGAHIADPSHLPWRRRPS